MFIWFLCAIAFMKIVQKFEGILNKIGINVVQSNGSMLGELMIAMRGMSALKNFGGGKKGSTSNSGGGSNTNTSASGLAGAVGRRNTNTAPPNSSTTQNSINTPDIGLLTPQSEVNQIGGNNVNTPPGLDIPPWSNDDIRTEAKLPPADSVSGGNLPGSQHIGSGANSFAPFGEERIPQNNDNIFETSFANETESGQPSASANISEGIFEADTSTKDGGIATFESGNTPPNTDGIYEKSFVGESGAVQTNESSNISFDAFGTDANMRTSGIPEFSKDNISSNADDINKIFSSNEEKTGQSNASANIPDNIFTEDISTKSGGIPKFSSNNAPSNTDNIYETSFVSESGAVQANESSNVSFDTFGADANMRNNGISEFGADNIMANADDITKIFSGENNIPAADISLSGTNNISDYNGGNISDAVQTNGAARQTLDTSTPYKEYANTPDIPAYANNNAVGDMTAEMKTPPNSSYGTQSNVNSADKHMISDVRYEEIQAEDGSKWYRQYPHGDQKVTSYKNGDGNIKNQPPTMQKTPEKPQVQGNIKRRDGDTNGK